MNGLIGLLAGVAILSLVTWMNLTIRRQLSATIRRYITRQATRHGLSGPILILHHADNLGELDSLLSRKNKLSMSILFDSPHWLAEAKKKKWSSHIVVHCPHIPQNLWGKVLLIDTNNRLKMISEVKTYLEDFTETMEYV